MSAADLPFVLTNRITDEVVGPFDNFEAAVGYRAACALDLSEWTIGRGKESDNWTVPTTATDSDESDNVREDVDDQTFAREYMGWLAAQPTIDISVAAHTFLEERAEELLELGDRYADLDHQAYAEDAFENGRAILSELMDS